MNCSVEIPMIGDNITCTITITKFGLPTFAYFAMLDFGDGYIQNLTIRNTDSLDKTFVVKFFHQYQSARFYNVRIMIPILNIDKFLIENVEIKGNLFI
jgi:hypothetical protein